MSKDITQDCTMVWRTIAKKGGWWSAYRLAREWTPVLSLSDIEQHLVTLWRGGFLAAEFSKRDGSVYSFTVGCIALPDEQLPEVLKTDAPSIARPARPDVMTTTYEAPKPHYRDGAMDHATCPSLQMGRRVAFHGEQR